MVLINFNVSVRGSFAHGFLKGLGAPLMLYSSFNMPALPEVQTIELPQASPGDAISGDWAKVGIDMQSAMNKYAEEPA